MSRYSVVRNATYGCIVIEGPIPVDDLVALTQAWQQRDAGGPAWIMDTLLSGALPGVNMVFGPPAACLAWREQLGIVVEGPPRSDNANDIAQRYCGNCNIDLED